MRRFALNFVLAVTTLLAIACGGGGGGSGTVKTVTVSGSVLLIDTLKPTTPPSTVAISSKSVLTDATAGSFGITVPSGPTSATVTYVPSTGTAQVFNYTFPAVTVDTDLGDLYVGPNTVTVSGRLVDSATAAAIVGGTVTFAGRSAVSASDGSFVLPSVAFPLTNLSGFLSLPGSGSASGYFNQSFQANSTVVANVISVGDVAMVPSGADTPPGLPADAIVSVTPATSGTTVTVLNGSSSLTTATTDASGHVQFWLPVGTYTLQATQGAKSGSGTLTITQTNQQSTSTLTLR